MSLLRGIFKNSLSLAAGQLGAKIIGMIFIALMARAVGPLGIGTYTFALSLIAIFMILPDFGFDMLLIRNAAKSEEGRGQLISNTLTIKLAMIGSASILLMAFMLMKHYDAQMVIVLVLLLISGIINSFLSTFYSVFRAYEKMEYEGIFSFLNSFLRAILGMTAIGLGAGLKGIILGLLIADVFSFLCTAYLIHNKFNKMEFGFDLGAIKHILRACIPFGISAVIVIVFINTDTLMIAKLQGEEAVGWYSAANKILMTLLLIPAMYMNAVFPVLSRLSVSSQESLRQTYQKSFSYLLMLALPIAVGGFLVSDQVILLIYGEKFYNSIMVFQVMVWVTMFSFVGYINGATLNATGREKLFVKISSIGTFANIILDYVLIKRFGYIGACYGTLVLSFIGFIIFSVICHKKLVIRPDWATIIKSILAALIMGGLLFFFKRAFPNIFILISVGALTYIFLIILFRTIPKEDVIALKSLTHRYGSY